ncbi:sacsin-like [Mercenaria mercenaria]|uniref:sacsin-like n=1 Tax=Mercenaria mercenaria TaxID=6596 RepID=UPI00234F3AE7|nr:sacsin-like [Mercenaria mercenaria]
MASTSGGVKMKKSIRYSRMKQPPLIKQLKGILSEYPDGGQILKELIQNAEDAGAREVKILHDNRRINQTPSEDSSDGSETTPLYTKFFKGPALCVYNDAVFTENDWEGIQMIYSSVKEEDPLKVGRFGLGFKSVFHITDFPCVISGDRVLLIDPQQPTEKVNATLDLCALEDYSEEGLDAEAFWNALENTFGLCKSMLGEDGFQGTLFWFPLREKTSELSETLYSETKVNTLFDSFKLEASNILLFLKNVEQISLHFRDNETPIKETLKTEIEDQDGTVRHTRSAFKGHIEDVNSTSESADVHSTLRMVIHTSFKDTIKSQEWLVVNYFIRESASEGFRHLIHDRNLGYSPYVGVASPLNGMSEEFEGHVFCFLPLPREGERLTGLPVHVNGFFALSQNRHHMKWETEEQEGKQIDDKSILWNKALIGEALPKAYEMLVLEAIRIAEKNSNEEAFVTAAYNAMPVCQNSTRKTHKRWMMLENKLYEKLGNRNIVYAVQTDEWIALSKAIFSTFRTLPGNEIDTSVQETVTKCLHKIGLKYAKLPNSLFDTMQMHFPYMKDLTPSSLVVHLQERKQYREMTCEDKIQTLAYLLLEEGNSVNIRHLELLPLASNHWTVFNKTNDPVYLCTDKAVKMFPGLEDKLVMESRKLGAQLSEKIENICKSETYQIQRLNVECAKTLLKQTILNHIGSDTNVHLTKDSSLGGQWLENVWHVLIDKNMVKYFKDIPLVPILIQGNWIDPHMIELVRLSEFIIVKEAEDSVLADGLCNCLLAMKVKVLPNLPEWIRFESIQEFVYRPTKESIASLLGAVYKKTGGIAVSEFNTVSQVNSQIREALIQFASTLAYIDKDVVKLLRKLRLFRAVHTIDDNGQYTPVADVPRYIHEDISFPPGVELPFSCIKLSTHQYNLIKHMEAEHISTESLVLSSIQNLLLHKKHDQISIFMKYFMENFNLFETNTAICDSAAHLPFLKVGTELHKPLDLFDPSSSSLKNLLIGESLFPKNPCEYSNDEIRALKRLGIKGKDKIDASVMLQVANTLSIWSKDDQKSYDLTRKAVEFLEILVHHPDLLDNFCNGTITLGNALMSVSCIPFIQNSPIDYPEGLPWFSKRVKICKPEEAKVVEWSLLAGATVPMVDCASDKVVHMFKWNVAPKMDIVLQQLTFICQHYNVQNKPDYMRAAQRIYKHLNQFRNEVSKFRNTLENNAAVWTGFGFELPRNVIVTKREQDLDLKPYYCNLPEEIRDMNDLFLQLGCHPEENSDILLSVLQTIKIKYESLTESPDSSLSRDSNIVLEILKVLASRRRDGSLDIDDSKLLMLVESQSSEKLSLQYISDCIFDDDQDELDEEEQKVYYIVNEIVPVSVASDLGIKSVKRKTILEATEGFSFEEWGQHESLTTRINTLLRDGYKDGLSVPKEVVQNADDAGATVVKFLYDERHNNDAKRKEKLFSSDLRQCQGPALWVYNDSQFTEKDLENITKLNGATKADYQDKIGTFGLGFCSVYNLTDVPSFISGKDMVIFDPHETYLEEARQTRGTGLRVRLSQRNLIRRNFDQFKPYSAVFGCNLLEPSFTDFSGTLFRLPLRTENQAAKSKICDEAYTKEEVSALLNKFVENAGNILLFTQNVKTLQIYYLSKDETDPSRAKLLFNINKTINQNSHNETARYTQSILKRIPTILKSSKDFSEIQHVEISQKHFESSFLKSTSEVSNSVSVETKWIVSWALGKNESLRLSKMIAEKGAVPLSAVAVPMRDKDDTIPMMLDDVPIGFYNTGHLFCFLPLPITTKLPVHVNGCFSVTSDRRGLSWFTEDDKKKGDNYMWNQALMEDSLIESYVRLLMFLSARCTDSYSYHSLWPLDGSDDVQVLKRSFFKTLILDKPKLFRGGQGWLSVDEIVYLDPSIGCMDIIGEIAFAFVSSVPIRQGKNIIKLPRRVLLSSQDWRCESKSIFIDAMIREEELLIHFLSTLDSVFWQHQLDKRNKLILYALRSKSNVIFKKLKETKCIPSDPDNVLCRPNELICPTSEIADMFNVVDGKFPLQTDSFCESNALNLLISLGMNDKYLPKDMLIERCKSIEELLKVCGSCAQERCGRFLKYCGKWEVMQELEKDTNTLNALKHALLLPSLPSPNNWKFTWQADCLEEHSSNTECRQHHDHTRVSVRFERPAKLFRESYYRCIGSVCCFLDENYIKKKYPVPERLFIVLGVKSQLTVELLLQQLALMSNQYSSSEQQFSSLEAISKSVYKWLGQLIWDKSENEISQMPHFLTLKDKPVILIGKELVIPCKVAFTVKAECPPDLYCLREVDNRRKKVFKALGVQDQFSVDYLISILKRLYRTWFQRVCFDIDTVTCLLLNLCESMKAENILYKDLKDKETSIIAPDSDGFLRPTSELVIEDPAYKSSASLHILHGKISPDTGRTLGVKSKKRKIVELFSSGFFKPFGQNESLVTRLTGILEDYPCDSIIMKELIQNADDAGATEIYFIKNYVNHSTEKIFGNEGLQGPSLCIFNNSYFTEEDFNGIRNLGIGSKRIDPSKTGQYGIGFNAVYHLTDVPSFLTKGPGLGKSGQICIFDPLMTFLEGYVTKENPGLICDVDLMEESFPDMLLGYPVIPSIETSGQGTIFRLPLRRSKSDISHNIFPFERMDRRIEAFKTDMYDSLLFLKSIKCIKVLNNRNGHLVEEFAVETKLSEEDALTRNGYFSSVKEVLKANIDVRHKNLCMQPIEASYKVNIGDNNGRHERWLIVNRFGIEHLDEKYSSILSALKENTIGLTPVASAAVLWPKEDWKKNQDRKTHENLENQDTRKAFCFLPLPVKTGLPLHINGHFALDKARTKLWNEGIRKSWNDFVIAELLSRACISAIQYMKREFVCKHLTEMLDRKFRSVAFEKYHELFPQWEKATDSSWKALVSNLYKIIIGENIELFPTINAETEQKRSDQLIDDIQELQLDWVSLSKSENDFSGTFNVISEQVESQYSRKPFQTEDAQSVENTVKKMGMKVIETPLCVGNSISQSGIGYISHSTPELVIAFLKTFCYKKERKCRLGSMNTLLSETTIEDLNSLQSILRYVMKDKSFYDKVQGLPLCLTNDGCLHTFDKSIPVFCSHMCNVLTGSSNLFVHSKLVALINQTGYYKAGVVKRLSVDDFVLIVGNTFRPATFASGNQIVWDKQTGDPFKPETLFSVFNFIYNESVETPKSNLFQSTLNHDLFQTNVRKLNEWSLMPACIGCGVQAKYELVPICQTSHLFHRSSGNRTVSTVIETFNIPQLDTSTFCKHGTSITYALQKMLPSTEYPVGLLECLHYYRNRVQASSLTCDDGITVLSYFDDKVDQMKNEMQENIIRNKLRDLPLYVSYQGDVISITQFRDVIILPDGIPSDGIDAWARLTGILLLRGTDKLRNLYKFLQLSTMTELEVYSDKILPSMQNLQRNTWDIHIRYMKDYVLRTSFSRQLNEKQRCLVEQLKSLAFIRVAKRNKKVCDLYDHRHTVFSCMLTEDCFLPKKYRVNSWLNFMETLGLIMQPTDGMIIGFAQRIEETIHARINKLTEVQSNALTDCLFSSSWTEQTLERIRTIRFIVPHKVETQRAKVASQPGNGDLLICFSGAVSYSHTDLCWSVLNLLSRVPTSTEMMKRLGIHEQPPIGKIVQHCQNVADIFKLQLEKRSVSPSFVHYQMNKLYKVFLKKFHVVMQQNFQVTPIVFHPEDEKMLSFKQVVISLSDEEEIRPYLYKLPIIFGPYAELFYKLGSHKTPISSDYSMVLNKIKEQFGDGPVPPSQLVFVKRALENIVKISEKERKLFPDVKQLFLPDRNNVLVSSKSLTVSNNDGIVEQLEGKIHINFFVGFKEMEIEYVRDPVLPFLKWPKHLRPDILMEVVTKQISTDDVVQEECIQAQRIERSLRSPQFIEGILRLVKHQMKLNRETFERSLENTLMLRLSNVRITKVTGLKTFLSYKGTKVEGTDADASCFIKSQIKSLANGNEVKQYELYFQIRSEEEVLLDLIDEKDGLRKMVDLCTGGFLEKDTSQYLSPILRLLEQPSEIRRKLDHIPIDAYDLPAAWNVSVFPRPGTYVEEKFHPFLEQSILPFKIHEYMYVALKVEDADDVVDPVYIYAHIICENSRAHDDSILRISYNVDVGHSNGLITVPLYRLYRFKPKQPEKVNALVMYDIEPIGSIPIEENFRRVRQILTEAWTMDETERKEVSCRLLTEWNPDRKGDHREYAGRVYNYVNEVVIKLEHKEHIDDIITNETGRLPPDMARSPFGSASTAAVYNRGCKLAAGFRDNMDEYYRSTRTGNFAHSRAEEAVVRHVREAKRWHRQAVNDFKAAESNISTGEQDQSFNWVCYKCHQASEKALKAAWFATNANKVNRQEHSLTAISVGLEGGSLRNEASNLETITGDYSCMRYPDAVVGRRQIPSEMFDRTKAEQAIEVTKRILDMVADFID